MNKYLLLLLLTMSSCNSYQVSPYLVHVNEIRNDYEESFLKKNDLSIRGKGGSLFLGVESIWYGLASNKIFELDEARFHIIGIAQALINRVEKNKEIQFYLKQPDKIERVVEISLSYSISSSFELPIQVRYVTLSGGYITYCGRDRITNRLFDIHRETYAEALEILNNENNKIN